MHGLTRLWAPLLLPYNGVYRCVLFSLFLIYRNKIITQSVRSFTFTCLLHEVMNLQSLKFSNKQIIVNLP